MRNKKISDMLVSGAIQIVPFSDKILYDDNDGDGIPNKDDPYPDEPFDERFMIVVDYDSIIPESGFVNKAWSQSETCYGSLDAEKEELITGTALISGLALCDAIAYTPLPLAGLWSWMQDRDSSWTWGTLHNAADMLYYYLTNSIDEVIINQDEVKDAILCHQNNILHLEYNLNQLMNVAEQTTFNNSNIICTKDTSSMRSICMVDRAVSCELRGVEVNGKKHPNTMMELKTGKQADWNLALGSCYGGMIAKVSLKNNIYSMTYRYYILDIYEWAAHEENPDPISALLHMPHEIGLSHQYLITGYYEGELTWKKGDTTADDYVIEQIYNTLGV